MSGWLGSSVIECVHGQQKTLGSSHNFSPVKTWTFDHKCMVFYEELQANVNWNYTACKLASVVIRLKPPEIRIPLRFTPGTYLFALQRFPLENFADDNRHFRVWPTNLQHDDVLMLFVWSIHLIRCVSLHKSQKVMRRMRCNILWMICAKRT